MTQLSRRQVLTAAAGAATLALAGCGGGEDPEKKQDLDANRSGVVLSSIHHREQARLYAKQVNAGRGELELSPEENEAIRLALEGDRGRAQGG